MPDWAMARAWSLGVSMIFVCRLRIPFLAGDGIIAPVVPTRNRRRGKGTWRHLAVGPFVVAGTGREPACAATRGATKYAKRRAGVRLPLRRGPALESVRRE